jgi:protein ImuB
MRYLSLWLENWGIEAGLGRRTPDKSRLARPLAAYARAGNVHRLVAVNAAARRLGLTPGLTLAEARARHPSLEALQHDPAAATERLAALTAWCRRFTPLCACDAPDGIILDITGAAHLFGGEERLIAEIETRLAAQGLTAIAAIAGTPEAAWALVRFSPHKIVAAAADAKRLARLVDSLPLAALRLDRRTLAALAQSGLRRIGDISLRPRGPLTARFGPMLFGRLDALMGRTKSPISPLIEAPVYLAERRFADGIVSRADVEATILGLAQDLAQLLKRHEEGARRLAVHLFRVDGVVKQIDVGTSRPLSDAQAIARLFQTRIDALSAGDSIDPLDAGYGFDVVQLAALAVEPLEHVQNGLGGFADADREIHAPLADLADRLGARLGVQRVRRLVPNDTHMPECAVSAVPAAELRTPTPIGRGSVRRTGVRGYDAGQDNTGTACASSAPDRNPSPAAFGGTLSLWERVAQLPARPIRLFEHPEPIDAIAEVPDGPPLRFRWRRVMHDIASLEGPERIAPNWWTGEAAALSRDYFRVEDAQGQCFWLFREGLYGTETAQPRWSVHGLFA